jgi:hypothetical protein
MTKKAKKNTTGRDAYVVENLGVRGDANLILQGKYDIYYFDNMTTAQARLCIARGWLDPKSCQNDSPDVETMVKFCETNPGFRMHGYVVTPGREDTRISLEGVISPGKPSPRQVENFAMAFRYADEFDISAQGCRAWYD